MNELSLEETCYMAGFIDGEGYMGIIKRFHTNQKGKWVGFTMNLEIGNTNLEVLEYTKSICDSGSIYKKKRSGNRKQAWAYMICGKDAQNLVKQIYPYLIVKKEIADVFLRFPFSGQGNRNKQIDLKNELHTQAKIINFRGNTELKKVQRLTGEELYSNKPDTRIAPEKDDIVRAN